MAFLLWCPFYGAFHATGIFLLPLKLVSLKSFFSVYLVSFFFIVSTLFFSFLLCTSFLLLWNSSFQYSCIVLSSAKFVVLFCCLYIALFIWYETLLWCFFSLSSIYFYYILLLYFLLFEFFIYSKVEWNLPFPIPFRYDSFTSLSILFDTSSH